MTYLVVKHMHMGFALLSLSLFILRGVWMLLDSPRLQARWVKILPHVVDTGLLASALVLVFWSHQYPFVQGWLTAKVLALVVYIGLGTVALKRGRTKRVRALAFFAGLIVFAYIASVAVHRSALL